MLKTLPDTPERAKQELMLQLTLGVPLQATKGWGVPEVKRAYARARELCQQIGETPQLFPVLWGLALVYVAQAEQNIRRDVSWRSNASPWPRAYKIRLSSCWPTVG